MKIINNKSGISYFFISLLAFFIFYLLAQFLFSLISLSFNNTVSYVLSPKNLFKKFIASIIYGLIMTFLIKKKQKEIQK